MIDGNVSGNGMAPRPTEQDLSVLSTAAKELVSLKVDVSL
jgi:hypothetical protein